MTVDEIKMIAKQYGYDFNPLLETIGDYKRRQIADICKEKF